MKKIKSLKELTKEKLIEIIKNTGRTYYSLESDFQFALAWKIKDCFLKEIKIRLEYPFYSNKYKKLYHIDIVIIDENDKKVFIELKYKKAKLNLMDIENCNKNTEDYSLTTSAAQNISCYHYWKDIERIEETRLDENFEKGFAIMLTNDASYKNPPKKNAKYINFSIDSNIKNKTGKLEWECKDIPNSYKKPIIISKSYTMEWQEWEFIKLKSDAKSKNNRFYLLINEINK